MGINVTQLAAELGAYSRTNNKEIRQMATQKSFTAKFMKTVMSVKGKFPALQSITGRLVQGFTAVWSPLGVTKFKVNPLVNYQQKVNYEFVPADINASWVAHLYEENKKPADMPISKYLIEQEIMPAVVRDREYLLGQGVYDANDKGTFGKSMDGIATIITKGLAANSENPVYQIPLEPVTLANIVDQVNEFEQKLPIEVKSDINKIYMSETFTDQYALNFFKTYGVHPTYTPEGGLKTIVGKRQLIGLPSLNGTSVIFATPDANFLRLIDLNDEPILNDVQSLDYKVKVFMEWWEGPAFWTNQMVIAGVIDGNIEGLAPAGANLEYYGKAAVVTA
ncbi:hypothetical protein Q5H92_22865 [Hymenobacter sp. M29]|uniref:Major capsid protein n=1 Tax=Hymenobacter mellowenesis TaxID=3063995 RepID=A0ABT9AH76_9BACT|nr:hypothetical protein [Hymenobacter sp. M29]MDO7849224.1 hypothetical protein [Hymenobacter sp. M29]